MYLFHIFTSSSDAELLFLVHLNPVDIIDADLDPPVGVDDRELGCETATVELQSTVCWRGSRSLVRRSPNEDCRNQGSEIFRRPVFGGLPEGGDITPLSRPASTLILLPKSINRINIILFHYGSILSISITQ